jgi:hypothetical protein
MTTESLIMMIVIVGGYAIGAFVLLSKVFNAQKARSNEQQSGDRDFPEQNTI